MAARKRPQQKTSDGILSRMNCGTGYRPLSLKKYLNQLSTKVSVFSTTVQSKKTEVFPMDEVQTFLRCYRIAVRDYQLPPKDSARVLVGVLRRIGCPCPAGHPPEDPVRYPHAPERRIDN